MQLAIQKFMIKNMDKFGLKTLIFLKSIFDKASLKLCSFISFGHFKFEFSIWCIHERNGIVKRLIIVFQFMGAQQLKNKKFLIFTDITKDLNLFLTLAKRICISKSANRRPKHILAPYPYGNDANGWMYSPVPPWLVFNHRSGRKTSEFLQYFSIVPVTMVGNTTWIPFGILYPQMTVSSCNVRPLPITVLYTL